MIDTQEWLATVEPIGLAELSSIADLQRRRDRKYIVPTDLLPEIFAGIGDDIRLLTIEDRNASRYESVYFDTPDLVSYLAAARRRPGRFKVRTRRYVDTNLCFLEVKTRDPHNNTVKSQMPYNPDDGYMLTSDARSFIGTFPEAKASVDELGATLTTRYIRTTAYIPSSGARVTIDTDLQCLAIDGRATGLPSKVIVETKSSGKPSTFDRLLWTVGVRPTTVSKYGAGVATLYDNVPANKWNRTLRQDFGWLPERHTPADSHVQCSVHS